MDQSFVYHPKLVISRLPSQIPWWVQPCVTFSCIVSCDVYCATQRRRNTPRGVRRRAYLRRTQLAAAGRGVINRMLPAGHQTQSGCRMLQT